MALFCKSLAHHTRNNLPNHHTRNNLLKALLGRHETTVRGHGKVVIIVVDYI